MTAHGSAIVRPMWTDDEGIPHTVALPDPAEVMSDDFRSGLDALVASHLSEVEDILEVAEAQIFEGDLSALFAPGRDTRFNGAAPPTGLLEGPLSTINDLQDALARVDLRWRLDAVLAVNDYID